VHDDRTPILVGSGQLTQRDVDPAAAEEPLAMMVTCARAAAEDAGLRAEALARLDRVAVVNILCWPYGNAPGLLAERLGAHPAESLYSTIGGNTPQSLVADTADAIAAGRVRLALIAGAEAVRTFVRAQRARVRLAWTTGGDGSPTVVGEARDGTSAYEVAHGLQMPPQVYPLFENALRAHRHETLAAQRARLGRLCAGLSAVAADNPHAWFRTPRTAEEIATPTATNRMIAFPYPKLMNAIIDVDQAAAVLMTSVGTARALGIPQAQWVYPWGSGEAHDHWFVTERVDYHSSPALRAATHRALDSAGVTADAIAHFDLYSCFPCAVELARDALGLAPDDPRPLTVTGGLPYFGGPGNDYSLHAIASMVTKLRAAPATHGLVTALGWYVTKHAAGVYAAAPPPRPWRRADPAVDQAAIDRVPHPVLALEAHGPATIETYTVIHDRDGAPMKGLVIGRLADARRFLAVTDGDRAVLEGLEADCAIGRAGAVSSHDGVNRFDPR
jgi:acetyl-CoA C-acetyltransferase